MAEPDAPIWLSSIPRTLVDGLPEHLADAVYDAEASLYLAHGREFYSSGPITRRASARLEDAETAASEWFAENLQHAE